MHFYSKIDKTASKAFLVGKVLIERARAKGVPLRISNVKNVPVWKVTVYKCVKVIKQLEDVFFNFDKIIIIGDLIRIFRKSWTSNCFLRNL